MHAKSSELYVRGRTIFSIKSNKKNGTFRIEKFHLILFEISKDADSPIYILSDSVCGSNEFFVIENSLAGQETKDGGYKGERGRPRERFR